MGDCEAVINKRKFLLDEQLSPVIIATLQRYCVLKDFDEHRENYYIGIFNLLYVNKKKLTDDEIAREFFIDLKTLYNYKMKINRIAEFIMKQIQSGKFCPIESEERRLSLFSGSEESLVGGLRG